MSRLDVLKAMAETSDFAKMLLEKRSVRENRTVEPVPVVNKSFTSERTDEEIVFNIDTPFDIWIEAAIRLEREHDGR